MPDKSVSNGYRGLSALVVDGDRQAAAGLRSLLLDQGISTRMCHGQAAAGQLLAAERFEVLFTESRLPDGEGISLICAARRLHPQIQAIITTDQPAVESTIEALRHRVTDFILKPVYQSSVAAAIERARINIRGGNQDTFWIVESAANGPVAGPTKLGNLRDAKRRLVFEALERSRGNKAAAAESLGISRRTLYRILDAGPIENR